MTNNSVFETDSTTTASKTEKLTNSDERFRIQLLEVLAEITPWDQEEQNHLTESIKWVRSGAPLWRLRKPDVPPMHLVSYFVVLDEMREELLLVAHRKAGRWLPTGGHVEPEEHPWETVRRECQEELTIEAVSAEVSGDCPLFITVSQTFGEGSHTDVSLWYVVKARREDIKFFDEEEFEAISWLSLQQVLETPPGILDPHMHRFTRKLQAALEEKVSPME